MSSPESPQEIPRITAEDLVIFTGSTRDFAADYQVFKAEQPDLAKWLVTEMIGVDPDYLKRRQAYVAGMVGFYTLLKIKLDIEGFTRAVEASEAKKANGDDVDDEDPLPSA